MTTQPEGPPALTDLQRARTEVADLRVRNQPVPQTRTVEPGSMAQLTHAALALDGGADRPGQSPDIETARAAAELPPLTPGQARDAGSSAQPPSRGPANGKSSGRPGVGD